MRGHRRLWHWRRALRRAFRCTSELHGVLGPFPPPRRRFAVIIRTAPERVKQNVRETPLRARLCGVEALRSDFDGAGDRTIVARPDVLPAGAHRPPPRP